MAISELTTNSIPGTGVFDVLMSAMSKHILEEYRQNRITGKEYATVYLGAMTAVLQQAIAYLTVDKQNARLAAEIALLQQKLLTEQAQLPLIDKQKALYDAQAAGFARDAEQKLAKIMVDSWSVRRMQDDGTMVPGSLDDGSIDTVIGKAKDGIGL